MWMLWLWPVKNDDTVQWKWPTAESESEHSQAIEIVLEAGRYWKHEQCVSHLLQSTYIVIAHLLLSLVPLPSLPRCSMFSPSHFVLAHSKHCCEWDADMSIDWIQRKIRPRKSHFSDFIRTNYYGITEKKTSKTFFSRHHFCCLLVHEQKK